jgi:hypothetical protein
MITADEFANAWALGMMGALVLFIVLRIGLWIYKKL